MTFIEPKILKGFRDYLPDEMIPKGELIKTISNVFERYGFSPISTPALEYAEILLGKYGEEGDKLLYKFQDNGGREVCLRYDLTVPLSRVVGLYPDIPKPFRRYHIAPVWRAEKPGKGRFREFVQCDVDIVGTSSIIADAECVRVDYAVLKELGIDNFIIKINNRKILNGILEVSNLNDSKKVLDVMRTIDKLPKIGKESVIKILKNDLNLDNFQIETVMKFLEVKIDSSKPDFTILSTILKNSEIGIQGINEIIELFSYLKMMGISENIVFDQSIARGLDYYTGSVFETFLLENAEFGSIMSGGRYDDLIGTFSKEKIPAVGISLGIDRLFSALIDLNLLNIKKTKTEVLVTIFDRNSIINSINLAEKFRKLGINTELYPNYDKLKKQFSYANKMGINYVIVVGPDEIEKKSIKIKEMKSGTEIELKEDEVSSYKAWLNLKENFVKLNG